MGTFLTGPEPRRGDVVWYNFTYNISLHSTTDWVWIQRIWRKHTLIYSHNLVCFVSVAHDTVNISLCKTKYRQRTVKQDDCCSYSFALLSPRRLTKIKMTRLHLSKSYTTYSWSLFLKHGVLLQQCQYCNINNTAYQCFQLSRSRHYKSETYQHLIQCLHQQAGSSIYKNIHHVSAMYLLVKWNKHWKTGWVSCP